MEVKLTLSFCISIGYSDNVSSSVSLIYWFTPLDKDMIKAIPIIPILPANATKKVRAFFVRKLLKLKDKEVSKDMLALPIFVCSSSSLSSTS